MWRNLACGADRERERLYKDRVSRQHRSRRPRFQHTSLCPCWGIRVLGIRICHAFVSFFGRMQSIPGQPQIFRRKPVGSQVSRSLSPRSVVVRGASASKPVWTGASSGCNAARHDQRGCQPSWALPLPPRMHAGDTLPSRLANWAISTPWVFSLLKVRTRGTWARHTMLSGSCPA
jgi:hypothetical protein